MLADGLRDRILPFRKRDEEEGRVLSSVDGQ